MRLAGLRIRREQAILWFWGRPWGECTLPEKEPEQTQGKMLGAMVDEEETYERAQDLLDRAGESERGYGYEL